jgi:adenosylmethionine-8-amino-7-oxononanoate aminotransferase
MSTSATGAPNLPKLRRHVRELAYFSGYIGSSNVPAITLATRLVELAYDNMQAVFFTTGGAEANESAFKTARFYWKAQGKQDKVKGIARHQAYHGLTLQTMSATGMGNAYWKMFEPRVPGFVHVQSCYPYRFQGAKPGETPGQAAARELEDTILREGPETIAAFIGEPIHGAGVQGALPAATRRAPIGWAMQEYATEHRIRRCNRPLNPPEVRDFYTEIRK